MLQFLVSNPYEVLFSQGIIISCASLLPFVIMSN